MIRFALAGNPNSGKTTLFNGLTGSTAHVGNWPGVTVDKREGTYKKCKEAISIVDLPGIYSLSPYTPEEVIARNYIIDQKPDLIINIVDATNLERNLYLTTQIMEIDVPMVIALNMIDVAEKNGNKIDEKEIEKVLKVPVVKISALKGTGLDTLMERAYKECKIPRFGQTLLQNSDLGHLIGDIKIALKGKKVSDPLFHAVKLVENDEIEIKMHPEELLMIDEFKKTFDNNMFGTDFEALVADSRYKYISKNFSPALKRNQNVKMTKSDKIDRVLTHKVWGIPIFLVILFAIFHLTFSEDLLFLGKIFNFKTLEELNLLSDQGQPINFGVRLLACIYDGAIFSPGVIINKLWNDIIIGEICGFLQGVIEDSNMHAWAIGLLNNGVIDGVSSVLSFLPWILVLFLFFSILEDSGYMARVAFILDRMFRRFGLSGRAFMPMIMGFGCSVPAMINTRTLIDENEKTATIRVIPFFSCGAKLPILTAIAGAIVVYFGVGNADIITYSMYVLGIVSAIVCIIFMRLTTLKGDTPPFIMELPEYHAPQFKNLMLHLWDKTKHFIKKAFTIILASTILIWVFSHFDFSWHLLEDEQVDQSVLAGLGKLLQPIFTPLGFGSQLGEFGWVFVVGAITGLIAKENVIGTFGTLAVCLVSGLGLQISGLDLLAEDGIDAVCAMVMATGITVPGLISFIAFNMTTIPCFAAVATAKGELGTKSSFNKTLIFWLLSSYIIGTIVYTIGSYWWSSFIWLVAIIVVLYLIIMINKKIAKKGGNK